MPGSNRLASPGRATLKTSQTMPSDDKVAAPQTFAQRAHALFIEGRLDEAEALFRKAVEAAPGQADGHNNLGIFLRRSGRLQEALACYRRALALDPACAEAHVNLANALAELGRFDAAIGHYRQGLELKPASAMAYYNLGIALWNVGENDAAAEAFGAAAERAPDNFEYAVAHAFLLPMLAESAEQTVRWRRRYADNLAGLSAASASRRPPYGALTSFYLAYHNADNRPLLERLAGMFRARVPSLTFTAPHLRGRTAPPAQGRRVRVGFLSEFFREHSIGQLYEGLIARLDRSRFEVVVIHTAQAKRDAGRARIDAMADRTLSLPADVPRMQEAVAAEALDVLFYTDIGDCPPAYFLSFARLAPVQLTSWGHPDTTGVDTLDYFLSCEGIEGPDADDLYSERLVRLGRLPCHYEPVDLPQGGASRARFGLAEAATVYACPQTLFKFHPDFDAVLADILAADAGGVLVIIGGRHPGQEALLRRRWSRSFEAINARTVFLPRMGREDFLALLRCADVLLDPLHFGSGNSMYEAMLAGTPIVTWPGRFARGRVVAAAYRQMGIEDAPIAASAADYVAQALRLGRDAGLREGLRRRLREAAGRALFRDAPAVREFEAFLLAAVAAAAQGGRLPRGWRSASLPCEAPPSALNF